MEKKAAVSFALFCCFVSVYSSEMFKEYRFANSRFIECEKLGLRGCFEIKLHFVLLLGFINDLLIDI